MAEPTNEMAINLPIIGVPPVGVVDVPSPVQDMGDSMVVGAPQHDHDPAKVTVYANNISPVTGNWNQPVPSDGGPAPEVSPVAVFDIVFSVGVDCGGGVTKTYQVVKRIGIDKCKIACEAECSTPVSVVESQSEELKAEAAATKKRFRILAGLE